MSIEEKKLNFDLISDWSTTTFTKISDLDAKIKNLTNEYFKCTDLSEKLQLSDLIHENISQLQKLETKVDNDIRNLSARFKNIDNSGGFTDEELNAYMAFTASKDAIKAKLTESKSEINTNDMEADLEKAFSKLEKVQEELPPLEQLQKGSVILEHFTHKDIAKDGNCLFAAIAYSLDGTEDTHAAVRKRCCDMLQIEEFGAEHLLNTPHSEEGLKDYYEGWCVRKAEDELGLKEMPRDMEVRAVLVEQGKEIILSELSTKLQREPTPVDIYREFMSQDKSHGGEVELETIAKDIQRPIIVFRGQGERITAQSQASVFGAEYEGKTPIVLYNMPGHYDAYILKSGR
ncbi:MAG: hypothetical protein JSR46_07595 [Verrucomicrobia bacterium]|nr:hypothetical protein [Verrucomicrobiota bacterium]